MILNLIKMVGWCLMLGTGFSTSVYGGHETHGGDTVLCVDDPASAYSGYYNLDYLLTYKESNQNGDIVKPASWEESRDRLKKILSKKHKGLAKSFDTYLKYMDNFDNYLEDRVWEESSFGLVVIKPGEDPYQLIDRKVPKNCYTDSKSKDISLIRTITREKRGKILVYSFDPEILKKLPPLQLSFQHLHEWLRDHTNDEKIIRRVNRLLHSDVVAEDGYDLVHAISNIGLNVGGGDGFRSVCERSTRIGELFELKFGLECSQIAGTMLQRRLEVYDFRFSRADSIARGDFSGLRFMSSILLSNNEIASVPEGAFYGLEFDGKVDYQRETYLDLSKNRIANLEPRSFVRLNMPHGTIDLSHNRIERLEADTFAAIADDHETGYSPGIDLSHNLITALDERAFNSVNVASLNLSHNHISELKAETFSNNNSYFRFVNLSYNKLTSVPLGLAKGVQIDFDLSHNQIREISDGAVPLSRGKLDLSHNLITAIKENAFGCAADEVFYTRYYINLSNNFLTSIPEKAVAVLKKCKFVVDLKGNHFNREWKHWLKSQLGDYVILD